MQPPMEAHMVKSYSLTALKAALPLVLGFVGGAASTFFLAYFTAFCSGAF